MSEILEHFKEIMGGYVPDVLHAVEEANEEVAKATVTFLKKNCGINKHRKRYNYVNTFKINVNERGYIVSTTVHNSNYRLTHLLEEGHAIKDGTGREIGQAGAFPHWKKAEEFVKAEFEKKLIEKINERW